MELLLAGDYCPQNRIISITNNTNTAVFGGLSGVIERADYSIVNLECPVTSQRTKPIFKQGPCLQCGVDMLDVIKEVGFDCVTLANNHFRDYGEEGCVNTIKLLTAKGLDYVGGGRNLQEALQVFFRRIGGKTISIINCCEREFSFATDKRAGANPFSPITQYHQIIEARKKAEFVILIIHGGVEHFQYPTKRMVQTYRFFIDVGADAVINHHQHCPCGYEIYKGKPIYYGLGNFCFDWLGKRNSIWNLGYMVKLQLEDNHHIKPEIIPYSQCDEDPVVKPLTGDELVHFNLMMKELCSAIKDESILDHKLREFNKRNDYLYRKMLEPYNGRLVNSLYRRGILPSTISKERVLALMDFILCESHHERVIDFLERQYKEKFNE